MRDLITKLAILYGMLRDAYWTWKGEIWEHDLDEPYCCSGYECGCMALTRREAYRPQIT